MNVVAVFEKFTFTLNTSIEGQGSVSRSPNASSYENGTSVTLTAIPASGWKFIRWEGDASGTSSTITVNMNSTKNIKAIFSQIKYYTLKITCGEYGKITDGDITVNGGSTKTFQFEEGSIVKLMARPNSGFKVDTWSGDLSGNATSQTIIMDSDKNCRVSFTRVQ